MKYNILGYLSFTLLIVGFAMIFSGFEYPHVTMSILLGSSLLGSISLYVRDRKNGNSQKSTIRTISWITILAPIIVITLLVLAGLMLQYGGK